MKKFITILTTSIFAMLMAAANVFAYKVGDKITFGSYPFYEDGREKAIDWIILDIDEDNNALVISDYALDNVSYNEKFEDVTWETSSIRKWLNSTFINKAFSVEQRSKIIKSNIANKDNAKYKTKGGNNTYDKLFLLSIDEANRYFKNDETRAAYPTPYAKSRNNGILWVNENVIDKYVNKYVSKDRGDSWWWQLRSPGSNQDIFAYVNRVGSVDSDGAPVNFDDGAVRPAFKINLNNLKSAKISDRSSKENVFAYNVGDKITFGSYPFYEDGREKAIDWVILDIDENNNALVISDYALDNVSYNENLEDVTWETSSIRKWLNKIFIKKVFTAEQRSKIIKNRIENNDNAEYKTKGGNETYDKLFLLSIEEAKRYFKNNGTRIAYPTPYAKSSKSVNGSLYVNDDYVSTERGGACWWWLRSPGDLQISTAYVDSNGTINSNGPNVLNVRGAVRPALKINLNNLKSTQTDGGSDVVKNDVGKTMRQNAAANNFVYNVGDIITFGSYPYEEDGKKRPIEWRILEKTGNNALVISKYALDVRRFDEVSNKWETSEIRQWLNNEFYNEAFNDKEKKGIIKYGEAVSKVFLLSVAEVNKYFEYDDEREVRPTNYAEERGAYTTGDSCWWWLRSPGYSQDSVAFVTSVGGVNSDGDNVYSVDIAVRPVLKINLNNLKSIQIYGTSTVAKFTKPPRLSVGNVSYSDRTNSNVLMADGDGKISFTVSNAAAGGTAYNLKAIVSAKDSNGNAVQGISFENTNEIGNIAPGKSVNVNIPIKTGENLAGGTAAFTITFSEANGFEPNSKTIKIQTVKTDPPDVQLAEFGLDDTEGELSFGNGNGIVEPGESIVLNLALLNNGDGIAKGTKITFESGDSEIHFIDNTQFSKGNIQPGGKVSLNTAFSISRRYKGSSTLPIKMKITDERKRFNKEIPLNIALKRSYPKTEIINIASNYKKPQKIKMQTDPLNNIPEAKTQNKYGVAVIIGVRNYENKVPPVLFAINDAQTVRDYVVKALGYNPDNIIYVENPTKGQMEEIFGTDKTHKGRLFNYIKPDRSDVLVYYAGHGAPDQGTKTAFFVPKDANPDYIRIGGYSMETFYANLAKLPAKNITVLTDACFSGQTGDGRMIINHASPLAVSAKLPGTVNSKISVFNAGRDSEMASWYAEKQHGLFTYYFLLGLGGQADTNNDKTITAREIDAYLQENVPGIARRLYNREQHPVFTGNRNATIAEYK